MGIISRIIWAGIIAVVLYIIAGVFFQNMFNKIFFSQFGFAIALIAMFVEMTFVNQ